MSIAEKVLLLKTDFDEVYEAGKAAGGGDDGSYEQGYEDGYNKAESENPFYYVSTASAAWANMEFPENYNLVMKVKKLPATCNRLCEYAKNLKTFKIINEEPHQNNINMQYAFRGVSSLISVDFTQLNNKFSNVVGMFQDCKSLVSIYGELDVSDVTNFNAAFYYNDSLEYVRFTPNSIKVSLAFSRSSKLTHDSLMSIINGLYDYKHLNMTDKQLLIDSGYINTLDSGIWTITDVIDAGGGWYDIGVQNNEGVYMEFYYDATQLNYGNDYIKLLTVGNDIVVEVDEDKIITFFGINDNVNAQGVSVTLTLHSTVGANLTEEQKNAIANKNWTLAY